jgi:uncharacterized membrane protein
MQPNRQQPGCARLLRSADQGHSVSKDHIKQTRAHRSKIGLIVTLVSLLVLFFSGTVGLCCLCAVCVLSLCVCCLCVRLRVEPALTCSLLSLCCLFAVFCVCCLCVRLHFVSSLHFRPLQTHHQVALVSVSVLQRLCPEQMWIWSSEYVSGALMSICGACDESM